MGKNNKVAKSPANALPADALPLTVVEYLRAASLPELQSFELARLDQICGLKRNVQASIAELVTASSEALLARVLIENHRARTIAPAPRSVAEDLIAEIIPELTPATTRVLPAESTPARRRRAS